MDWAGRLKEAIVALVILGGAAGPTGVEPATVQTRADQLEPLIEASGLTPWVARKFPANFELPDSSDAPRSLAKDFHGRVVLLYMFAQW